MNKFLISILAILGGIELVFYLITPILIAIFWIKIVGLIGTSYLLIAMCFLATLFRAIKVGFLKN